MKKTFSCLKAAFWTAVLKPVNVLLNSFFSETLYLFSALCQQILVQIRRNTAHRKCLLNDFDFSVKVCY